MKKILKFVLGLLVMVAAGKAQAQQNLTYNHYFINPFLYNPSFIAQSGYSELHLNYRKQWAGFEGAPQTATMNLQLPLSYKTGFAVTGFQDEAGLIKTTTGLVSFSYQVFLGKRIADRHKIGFGISAGYTNSRISDEESYDFQDPVLGNRTSSLDGQFGMHYQYNRFKLAFAIPRLFQNNVAAEASFTHQGITQIKNTLSSISYEFQLSPLVSLEPIFTYRTSLDLEPQYEALASLKLSKIGWIGAAYRQDYGLFAFLGLDLKEKLKVGYAYEFAAAQSDKIGYGSHEVQLVVRLGRKQFTRSKVAGKSTVPANTPAIVSTAKPNSPAEQDEPETAVVNEENVVAPSTETSKAPARQVVTNTKEETLSTADRQTQDDQLPDEPKTPVKLNGDGLAPGHYVVVGVFVQLQNALDYTATLKRAGYPASVAFNPVKNQYIVHMRNAPTVEEARQQRDKYRQMSRYSFRDTWILTVE